MRHSIFLWLNIFPTLLIAILNIGPTDRMLSMFFNIDNDNKPYNL